MLLALFASNARNVSAQVTGQDSTIDFIESSLKQIRKKTNSGDVPSSLKQGYGWFKKDMKDCRNQPYFNEFTQRITNESIDNGIFCKVEIITDKPGARVKYQTVFNRIEKVSPMECNNPTNNCINQWPLGYYYVWTERNNKPTSDTTKRLFISGAQKIILQE
jgi:hypothetical protein